MRNRTKNSIKQNMPKVYVGVNQDRITYGAKVSNIQSRREQNVWEGEEYMGQGERVAAQRDVLMGKHERYQPRREWRGRMTEENDDEEIRAKGVEG